MTIIQADPTATSAVLSTKPELPKAGYRRQESHYSETLVDCPNCGSKHRPTLRNLQKHVYQCAPCRHPRNMTEYAKGDERRGKRWSRAEVEAMVLHGEVEGRGSRALASKAWALGIKRKEGAWSEKEKSFLGTNYADRGCAYCMKKLGRSRYSIVNKARLLGLKTRRGRAPGATNFLTKEKRERLYETVESLVPRSLPRQVREEVVSGLILDVLDRRIRFDDLPQNIRSAITRVYAMFPNFGAPLSLDAPLFEDGNGTLGERIHSTAFRF